MHRTESWLLPAFYFGRRGIEIEEEKEEECGGAEDEKTEPVAASKLKGGKWSEEQ